MPATTKPRPILSQTAPNRFKVDKPLLQQVVDYLEAATDKVTVLPHTHEQLDENTYKKLAKGRTFRHQVATALLNREEFAVEGFSLAKNGMCFADEPDMPVLLRPYAYLSHLLCMDVRIVTLLFGPMQLNDMMMRQWTPSPSTDRELLLMRLVRYLREGNAVCSV